MTTRSEVEGSYEVERSSAMFILCMGHMVFIEAQLHEPTPAKGYAKTMSYLLTVATSFVAEVKKVEPQLWNMWN